MKNIRVVTVEVGTIDTDGYHQHHREETSGSIHIQTSMEGWSASEKLVYGQSFLTVNGGNGQVGKSRKPTPVSHFVRTIVGIVNGQSHGSRANIPFVINAFCRFRSWLRGDSISVGAGAGTYVLASKLPSFILDALINLPHFLVSARNGLLPVIGTRTIPVDQIPPPVAQQQKAVTKPHEGPVPNSTGDGEAESATAVTTEAHGREPSSGDEQSNPSGNDDTDVESNAGDAAMVESSWINLREKHD